MYKIERTKYGFHLTFSGFIDKKKIEMWYQDSSDELKNASDSFGLLIDMRTLRPLPADSRQVMDKGLKMYRANGLIRSVVILYGSIPAIHFKRIGIQSGMYEWERYIDSSSVDDWETISIRWLEDAIDPDK